MKSRTPYIMNWMRENPERVKEIHARYKAKNKQKSKAHGLVYRAIKKGLIIPSTHCKECKKEGRVEAHHPDYSRPLYVIFYCRECHKKIHVKLKQKSKVELTKNSN